MPHKVEACAIEARKITLLLLIICDVVAPKGKCNTQMFLAQIVLFLQQCPMELIVLSGKFLSGAMFENLDLPQPHYFTRALEQGGYVSIVEFYPDKLFRLMFLLSISQQWRN